MEISEFRTKITELENIIDTKDTLLLKTKNERDNMNMTSQQKSDEAETQRISLMTQETV